MELSDKTVVVTGAAGIVGGWVAAAFAKAGAKLWLTDVDAAALEARAAELPGARSQVVDLADAAAIDRFVAAVGAPDILVNNAGVYPSGWLLDIDAAEWDRIMDVNVRAPFLLSRGFARAMVAEGVKGVIINVSSGAARKMRTTVVPYCVSKTALDRLTKGFAIELARHGIRVNALEPGFAPGSKASPLTDAHVKSTTAGIPMGRAATAEDIGNAVLFLASPKAGFVTGATLSVDGGNSIGSLVVYQDKKEPL